jgi:ABC-type uncharacterized transport system substrate-binding protein
MDLRWGGDDISRIGALAQELVGLQPEIILASTTAATAALQRETRTIPIVFVNLGDPVASGLVARLDRPSGNVTGFGIALGRGPGGGLVVMPDGFMVAHRAPITSAAARNNVPAVYSLSVFARGGGLLAYGVDQVDTWRRAASYVDRILRGAKPAELPAQLPTKFEMVLNLKTAKALGLAVPPSILLRATEVIE